MAYSPEFAMILLLLIPLVAAVIIPIVGGKAQNAREAVTFIAGVLLLANVCLLYTSPSPRDGLLSRMPSSS